MMRTLVLDSGIHQKQAFGQASKTLIYRSPSRIRPHSLGFFDIIVIPFHVDQEALSRLKKAFIQFIDRSGVVVVLGATDLSNLDWIPYTSWNQHYPKECVLVPENESEYKALFQPDLTGTSLKFHTGYSGHGFLIPHDLSECKILVTSENGHVLMFCRRFSTGGSLLVTTLDPDHHSVPGTPGPSLEQTAQTQRNALILLQNVLKWASNRCNHKLRRLRRASAVIENICSLVISILTYSIPGIAGYVIYRLSEPGTGSGKNQIYAVLVSAGVVASIAGYWQNASGIFKRRHE